MILDFSHARRDLIDANWKIPWAPMSQDEGNALLSDSLQSSELILFSTLVIGVLMNTLSLVSDASDKRKEAWA